MRQETLHAFFQNSNPSIKSATCSRLISVFILISHIPKCNNCRNDKVFGYKFTYSYTHAVPHASHWPRSKFMVSLGLVMCAGVVGRVFNGEAVEIACILYHHWWVKGWDRSEKVALSAKHT